MTDEPKQYQLKKTDTEVLPEPKNGGSDPKQMRIEHVGKLLEYAYQEASNLKLKDTEARKLREDFPDEAVELRPHDGIVYISHMLLRERLWDVFGPGSVAEICRERFMKPESNEIGVDLVLLIRGAFVAEAIGTSKYYPNNPNMGYGDAVEAAWSDALRRCCKKFGVGTQVWRPQYIRDWKQGHANQTGGKWQRRSVTNIEVRPPKMSQTTKDMIADAGVPEPKPVKGGKSKPQSTPPPASNYSRLLALLHVGGFTGEDFMVVAHKNMWFPERLQKLEDIPDPDLGEFTKEDNLQIIMNQLEAMPRHVKD